MQEKPNALIISDMYPGIEKVENLGSVYKNIPDADHDFYRKSEVLSQMLQAPEIIQLLDTNKYVN